MRAVRAAGGTPFIEVRHTRVTREIIRGTDQKHAARLRDIELYRMKKMQAYIAIRGSANASENSDVPATACRSFPAPAPRVELPHQQNPLVRPPLAHRLHGPDGRNEHQAFEDYFFNVCTLDYAKMSRAMAPSKNSCEDRQGPHPKGPRHRPPLLHQKHPRHPLRRTSSTSPTAKSSPPPSAIPSTASSTTTAPPFTAASPKPTSASLQRRQNR